MSTYIEEVSFLKGETIFSEGEESFHFFIVQSGVVSIFTISETGERIDLAEVTEGNSFGELAFLDKEPRSAFAEAKTSVDLVRVSQVGFTQLLSELPDWAECMLRSFSERLKATNAQLRVLQNGQ